MAFLYHSPLEGEELQLVYWVVGFSLAQASTGIGYHCFGAILLSLIEDSPKPVLQASVWSLNGLVKSAYARMGAVV